MTVWPLVCSIRATVGSSMLQVTRASDTTFPRPLRTTAEKAVVSPGAAVLDDGVTVTPRLDLPVVSPLTPGPVAELRRRTPLAPGEPRSPQAAVTSNAATRTLFMCCLRADVSAVTGVRPDWIPPVARDPSPRLGPWGRQLGAHQDIPVRAWSGSDPLGPARHCLCGDRSPCLTE